MLQVSCQDLQLACNLMDNCMHRSKLSCACGTVMLLQLMMFYAQFVGCVKASMMITECSMSGAYLQLPPCCSLCLARLQLSELATVPGASVRKDEGDHTLLSCPTAELPG